MKSKFPFANVVLPDGTFTFTKRKDTLKVDYGDLTFIFSKESSNCFRHSSKTIEDLSSTSYPDTSENPTTSCPWDIQRLIHLPITCTELDLSRVGFERTKKGGFVGLFLQEDLTSVFDNVFASSSLPVNAKSFNIIGLESSCRIRIEHLPTHLKDIMLDEGHQIMNPSPHKTFATTIMNNLITSSNTSSEHLPNLDPNERSQITKAIIYPDTPHNRLSYFNPAHVYECVGREMSCIEYRKDAKASLHMAAEIPISLYGDLLPVIAIMVRIHVRVDLIGGMLIVLYFTYRNTSTQTFKLLQA